MSKKDISVGCKLLLRLLAALLLMPFEHKGNKRKDYAFWHQFNEKPSMIPGCLAPFEHAIALLSIDRSLTVFLVAGV